MTVRHKCLNLVLYIRFILPWMASPCRSRLHKPPPDCLLCPQMEGKCSIKLFLSILSSAINGSKALCCCITTHGWSCDQESEGNVPSSCSPVWLIALSSVINGNKKSRGTLLLYYYAWVITWPRITGETFHQTVLPHTCSTLLTIVKKTSYLQSLL